MKKFLAIAAFLSGFGLAFCGNAQAHGGGHTKLMGTIRTLSESEIIVTTPAGEDVAAALDSSTRYLTVADEKGEREQLQVGMRVVVEVSGDKRKVEEVRYQPEVTSQHGEGAGDE